MLKALLSILRMVLTKPSNTSKVLALLNKCINYITLPNQKAGLRHRLPVRGLMVKPRIYEIIEQSGSRFTLVRFDCYPVRKIGTFKPKLFIKTISGFKPVRK